MSNATIGNLRVNLAIDTAEFSAGARSAQATLAGLSKSMRGFGAGLVGALSLGAVASSVDNVIHKVAEIGDVAEAIGITAEQLQVYNRMALASGSSSEAMARGLQEVAEQSTDVNSKLSQLFTANGLTTQGRPVNDVIRDFMTLLQNAKTPAEQLAMATSVLGTRVGRGLVEAFRAGAQGVDESTKAMVASGNYFSNAEIARAQEIETRYNQVMANIATGWQRMVIGVIDGLNAIREAAPEPGGKFNRMGWDLNQPAFSTPLLPPTVNMGPMGGPGQFPQIKIKTTVLPPDNSEVDKLKERLAELQRQLNEALKSGNGDGGSAIEIIPPGTIDDIYGAGEAFQTLWEDMDSGVYTTNELNDALQGMSYTMTDSLGTALSGIISGTSSAKEAFADMAQSVSQDLSRMAAQLLSSGLMQLLSGAFGGIGGISFGGMSFGGFYANGGILGAGQWGIAGEAGPELIHGPARITPMDRGYAAPQMNVTVINNSSASVTARQNNQGDLEVMIEDIVADRLSRGGNKIDSAMSRGFGLRRAGR